MSTALTILKHDDRIGPGWLLDRCDPERQPLRLMTVTTPEALPMAIECQGVLLVGRSLDPEALLAQVDENTKLVFLCSPNNPTSNLLEPDKILRVVENYPGPVILDEAYIDFSGTEGMIRHLSGFPNLVILRTFSKLEKRQLP